MKILSKFEVEKIHIYLTKEGRPLDLALFEKFVLETGDTQSVLYELAKFQNTDGGFGHGLEPDLRSPDSSALASAIALEILNQLNISSENKVLIELLNYFRESLDEDLLIWPIITDANQRHPRAPWWHGDALENFNQCFFNPRAYILSGLILHRDIFGNDLHNKIIIDLIEKATDQTIDLSMHDLICLVDLYDNSKLDESLKTKIKPRLKTVLEAEVQTDPKLWEGYGSRPIWFVKNQESLVYKLFQNALLQNLDHIIEGKNEDGTFPISWDWGGLFPEFWDRAEKDWLSYKSQYYVRILKSFNRLG